MSNGQTLEQLAEAIKKLADREESEGLTREEYQTLRHLERQHHYLDHKKRTEKRRVYFRRKNKYD